MKYEDSQCSHRQRRLIRPFEMRESVKPIISRVFWPLGRAGGRELTGRHGKYAKLMW